MGDSVTSARVEPTMENQTGTDPEASAALRAAVEPTPAPAPAVEARTRKLERDDLDQLSRIEEKASRIEEKYARTEALLLRLEDRVGAATGRMGEVARGADLVAVRNEVTAIGARTRGLPGLTALVMVAIVTALLTSAITLVLLRYGVPGLTPR